MRRKEDAKVVFGSVLFVVLLFLGLPGAGYAAPIVAAYEGQLTVKQSVLAAPGRVAVGEDGTFYVSDGYRNHVAVFAGNGAYKEAIPMPNASAVAVAPDGTLYIGSHKDYSVAIVRNGQVAGHLGGGAKEFRSVTDIAVDAASGNIYVADSVGNDVKIYDSSGTKVGGISVKLPMGVSVAGREVYILSGDAPVAVYDVSGSFLRNIGESGLKSGQVARPTGIALMNGMVYVSDTGRDAVVVYDTNGACLSEIRAGKGEINIPFSLALSGSGILYVTSKQNQGVHAFTVNNDAGAVPGAAGK